MTNPNHDSTERPADDFHSELFPAASAGAAPPPPPPSAPQPLWGTPQAMMAPSPAASPSKVHATSSTATQVLLAPSPPPIGPSVAQWSQPSKPMEGSVGDAYFKKATVSRTSVEDEYAPASAARPNKAKLIKFAVIAAVAVGAFFVTSTLFFNGEPQLYTGADGEITEMKPKKFFRPLDGYKYQEVPQVFLDQARSIVAADATAAEAMKNITARGVMQGGQVVAGAVVISVGPEFMEDQAERQSGLVELEKATDASAEKLDVDGKVAYVSSGIVDRILDLLREPRGDGRQRVRSDNPSRDDRTATSPTVESPRLDQRPAGGLDASKILFDDAKSSVR